MIKNFIYLDKDKMYSLSSQVFEGITEYLINNNRDKKEESNSQKGPVGSGRIMAEIIGEQRDVTEKKYLHDYAYVLFEEHLIEQGKVLNINEVEKDNIIKSIKSFPFIKIKGTLAFNDVEAIKSSLSNFNKFGEALTHITSHEEIEKVKEQFEQLQANSKDRNKKTQIKNEMRRLTNIGKLAKEKGLKQDQVFLDHLEFLFSYGFQDQFEIQIENFGHIFSANLKRDDLKEREDLLIRKYSRKTEVEFVIFGMVAQYLESGDIQMDDDETEYENIKEGLMNLVLHFGNVEKSFTGRLSNEIVIDPIAVYVEL